MINLRGRPKSKQERREKRQARSTSSGQAMVEFALLVPFFLIIFFIVVDFGVGFSRWIVITNSAREAARVGAIGADVATIKQKAVDTSNGVLTLNDVTVNYTDGPDDNTSIGDRGDSVVVRASHNYTLLTPLGKLLTLAFNSINISACSDMRLELGVQNANGGGGC